MKPIHLFILIVIVAVIIGGSFYFLQGPESRIVVPTLETPDSLVLSVGSTGRIGDVSITFNSLTEDNRCPVDVMCIQAGSVTANVTLSSKGSTETFNLAQDEVPHEFGGYQISITSAEPSRREGVEIAQAEYRITFSALPFSRVTYTCESDRSIVATYAGEEVHLTLDDARGNERQFYVSRVVSASGEKYSTGDDTLVFWNKGETAFITEQGGDTTFANCLEKN